MNDLAAVVIGAGPAGAVSAMLLARDGHDVLLLDRREFPRAKPCGDCLSAGANRLLDRLGLYSAVLAESPALLDAWRLFAPSGAPLTLRFADAAPGDPLAASALALRRDRLDAVLLDAARRAGAEVRLGVRVERVETDRARVVVSGRDARREPVRYTARIAVGADGLRSTVARSIGAYRRAPRLRKVSLTAHLPVGGIGAAGELHFGDGVTAGVAPVDADRRCCNVTVVASARYARAIARDATGFFAATLSSFPALRGRTDPRAAGEPALLASGPFDWPARRVVSGRVALAGDAAGYYDPLTGQGIYQAIAGAAALARRVSPALRGAGAIEAALPRYARDHARLSRATRLLQTLIEFVTARPGRCERALYRLAHAPRAATALLAATADLAHPARLLSPGALLSFASPCPLEESQ